ncbi:MAG: type II toxin-antitoxin system HicB family antitoxin [Clostridiales bacterium]|nr:type II toxin-antitoxin system HicB family antitoxin [Clostridiales bacterium]
MSSVKDYKVVIAKVTEADGGGYIAHIPELDCIGDGETMEKAIADVYAVAEDLIEIAREDGKEIPMPQYYKDIDDFSGKLSIRLPKTLHKQVSERAKAEECSINQLIGTYIAMGVGDAFGRIESLMERKEESISDMTIFLSIAKEMWEYNQKQQLDLPNDYYVSRFKGGRIYEGF